MPFGELARAVPAMLAAIQNDMLEARRAHLRENTHTVSDYAAFQKGLDETGGFFRAPFCGDRDCEARIKEETKATVRCIPLSGNREEGRCLRCDGPSHEWVYFARAY